MIEPLGKGRKVHRDVGKAYALKILNIMRHYYSLRDIEKILDLPAQTIWKYVNLVAVPEEKTVAKIISKVSELRIIDKLVDESIREFRENPVNVLSRPGFLKLFSYVAEIFVGDAKIDLVMPISSGAMILSSYLATELLSAICPFIERPIQDRKGYAVTYYTDDNGIKFIALPKSCLKDRSTVLLVDIALEELSKLRGVSEILSRARMRIYGLVAIDASEAVLENARNVGLKVMTLKRRCH